MPPPAVTEQRVDPVPHVVVAASHFPALQTGAVDGHTFPHEPQLRGSLARFGQKVLPKNVHADVPGRHAHVPVPLQYWSSRHVVPQAPQLFGSSMRSRHAPPQFVVATGDVGHEHVLVAQLAYNGQRLPHVPQLFGSFVVSTQFVPPKQIVPGDAHMHAPAEHVPALPHETPHAPQFAASLLVSTQRPPQST